MWGKRAKVIYEKMQEILKNKRRFTKMPQFHVGDGIHIEHCPAHYNSNADLFPYALSSR